MANYGAYGTLLKINAVTVAGVVNVTGPNLALDTIDVSNHSSTGGWREFVAGLLSGGQVTFELNYDPAAATHRNAAGGLLYELVQRTSEPFSLTFPDTSVISFTAFVTGFVPGAPVADKLSANVTMQITGAVTLP